MPLLSAAEIAEKGPAIQPPVEPEDEVMPTDAEFLAKARFISSIPNGPAAQLSGQVFWGGQSWRLDDAIRHERNLFLEDCRNRWIAGRDARRQQREEAQRRALEQAEFEARAAQWHYLGELEAALKTTQQLYQEGCDLAAQLKTAGEEKVRLGADESVDLSKLQKQIGAANNLIEGLTLRIEHKKTEYTQSLGPLKEAALLASREAAWQAGLAKEPLQAATVQAIKRLMSVDEVTARELASRVHGMLALANVLSLNAYVKPQECDPLSYAKATQQRASGVKSFLAGSYKSYSAALGG